MGTSKKRGPRPQPDAARAAAHPIRAAVLAELLGGEVLSPTQIAARIGKPLGTVAYHVRVLQAAGYVEEVYSTPRRGAVQHHYRAKRDGNLIMNVQLSAKTVERLYGDIRQLVAAAQAEEARHDESRSVFVMLMHEHL